MDKYLDPFTIMEILDNKGMAYRLNLLTLYYIYNIFSILLLKPYKKRDRKKPLSPLEIDKDGKEHFKIKKIIGYKGILRNCKYYIY